MRRNKKEIKEEVEKYMKLPYTFRIVPEEDGTFFIMVEELPGCMSEGHTVDEAMEMIKDAMRLWLEDSIGRGLEIPKPEATKEYSGKLLVRLPSYLHERLAKEAKRERISLNQYIVSLLSEREPLTEVKRFVQEEISKISAARKVIEELPIELKKPLTWKGEQNNGRKRPYIQWTN